MTDKALTMTIANYWFSPEDLKIYAVEVLGEPVRGLLTVRDVDMPPGRNYCIPAGWVKQTKSAAVAIQRAELAEMRTLRERQLRETEGWIRECGKFENYQETSGL